MQNRTIAVAFASLGTGIALNAVLGPLMLGVIHIRESPNMETQLLGGEFTCLLLAAPLAMVAAVLWWRGHGMAPLVGAAPAGFGLYMYLQYVLVPDYSRYDGNSEQFFALYLVLVMLSWMLLAVCVLEIARRVPVQLGPSTRRVLGALLVLMNSAFALAWVSSIVAVNRGARPAEYLEHPTAFWLIRLMDLGFVIPIGVSVGIGLLRDKRWANLAAPVVAGVEFLLSSAVAGMAINMTIRHDPAVTVPLLMVSTSGAITLLWLYVSILMAARATMRHQLNA